MRLSKNKAKLKKELIKKEVIKNILIKTRNGFYIVEGAVTDYDNEEGYSFCFDSGCNYYFIDEIISYSFLS